jgi:hypothetical protein
VGRLRFIACRWPHKRRARQRSVSPVQCGSERAFKTAHRTSRFRGT